MLRLLVREPEECYNRYTWRVDLENGYQHKIIRYEGGRSVFEFTDDCKTGIVQIDSEHEFLFSIMNQITETVQKGLDSEDEKHELENYLEQLKEYGANHFAHEEAYMEEHGDPELEHQKKAHAYFVKKIGCLDLQDLNSAEKRKILEDMILFLTKWLYQHIIGSDTLIGHTWNTADKTAEESDSICAFTKEYWTNIPMVDREHAKLFEIIGRAYYIVEHTNVEENYDDVMRLLDELESYTQYHFSHEEEYMESIDYEGLPAQRRAHETFLVKLEDKDEAENVEDRGKFVEDMLDFLFAWLNRHILKMDKLIPVPQE